MKYCRDNAIQNAIQLFWQKGYQGTSMRDIQVALNMRPGSIYAGFGNKEGLFAEVVSAYVKSTKLQLDEIANTKTPLAAFKSFLLIMVESEGHRQYQQQCLLVRSLSELQHQDIAAKTLAIEGLAEIERSFVTILKAAQKVGELPNNYDYEKAASWLQQQVMGVRAYSALDNPQFSARRAVDNIIALLPLLPAYLNDEQCRH